MILLNVSLKKDCPEMRGMSTRMLTHLSPPQRAVAAVMLSCSSQMRVLYLAAVYTRDDFCSPFSKNNIVRPKRLFTFSKRCVKKTSIHGDFALSYHVLKKGKYSSHISKMTRSTTSFSLDDEKTSVHSIYSYGA